MITNRHGGGGDVGGGKKCVLKITYAYNSINIASHVALAVGITQS